jgi:hypothetical protein
MRSLALLSVSMLAAAVVAGAALRAQAPTLDYETFKAKVQPIFLVKHEGFARCYVCHSQGTPFRLQRLSEGASSYNEEQSKLNFQAVQKLVKPGDPKVSRLMRMPLSHDAGGTEYHPGGKRWESTTNAEYTTIAEWIRGTR